MVATVHSAQVAAANAPFHQVADLQRELWLPALVCSSGSTAQRLHDLPAWEAALCAGVLPGTHADLGDPTAPRPCAAPLPSWICAAWPKAAPA